MADAAVEFDVATHVSVAGLRPAGYRRRRVVQVMVNGEARALEAGATVADLVAALGLGPRRIAVEVNRAVVPRAEYGATALRDGDAVEIIHFVGGG